MYRVLALYSAESGSFYDFSNTRREWVYFEKKLAEYSLQGRNLRLGTPQNLPYEILIEVFCLRV